jgi:hypothetical protein
MVHKATSGTGIEHPLWRAIGASTAIVFGLCGNHPYLGRYGVALLRPPKCAPVGVRAGSGCELGPGALID